MKQTALPEAVKRKTGSSLCGRGVECFTLAWTAGLLSAFLHMEKYAVIGVFALFLAFIIFRRALLRHMLLIVCGALLGIGMWMQYDANVRQPLCAMDGETVTLDGKITDLTPLTGDRMIYTLRTELAGHRCTLDWYANAGTPMLQIGDRVTLNAELTRIASDYRYHTDTYQAGQGKYLRIYKASTDDIRADTRFSLMRVLCGYRQKIAARIRMAMPPEEAELLCAMIFGDKSGLGSDTRDILKRSGIAHIAVVSGLHLVFFCGVLMWIFRRLSIPARLSFLLLLPAIGIYILFVDASVSVYRAAVMILLTSSARLFGRRSDTLRSLCLAMFLCTAFAPYVIGAASFWLTVSGVLGIGIIAPHMTAELQCGRTARTFLGLCCVSLTVFPASVLLCGESSLLGPLTNLLVLPLCIFALYLGFSMLLTGGLTAFLLPAASILCRAVRVIAGILSQLPYSHITMEEAPVRLALALLTAALLILLTAKPEPHMIASAVMSAAVLLAVLSACMKMQQASQLRVAVLGGKKQSALVISANGATVIADLTDSPRNAQYVERYLEQNGIARADVLILSGSKAAAGYQSALHEISVGAVMLREADTWREDAWLCGSQPYFSAGEVQIQCGDAEITLTGDELTVDWQHMRIEALSSQNEDAPQCEAVIRYGAAECAVTLPAVSQTESGTALLLRLTKNGKGDIRALDQPHSLAEALSGG